MNKNMKHILSLLVVIGLGVGCSSKNQTSCALPDDESKQGGKGGGIQTIAPSTKNNAYPYKAIIGTRNNDAKTVVDYGTVLKVYVAPYKDSYKSLVGGHDRYVFAKEPGFIVGADKPVKHKRTGMVTPKGSVPFMFNGDEIDKHSLNNNTKISKLIDATNAVESNKTAVEQKMESANAQLDEKIKRFLEAEKNK